MSSNNILFAVVVLIALIVGASSAIIDRRETRESTERILTQQVEFNKLQLEDNAKRFAAEMQARQDAK